MGKITGYIFVALLILTACHRKGCTDPAAVNYDEKAKKEDGSCLYPAGGEISFHFTHTFNGVFVNNSSFNQLIFQNEHGEWMSISKLIYHISNVRFYLSSGDSILVSGYHLVDLSQPATTDYTLPQRMPFVNFTGIGFNLGFIQSENISGAYSDLNAANWNWPENLGGGYHQLQLEGKFIDQNTDTVGYAYHSGSTVRELVGSESVFHTNYIWYKLPVSDFELAGDATVELNMELAEWFKNPNLWDLNLLNNSLMGNYNAQVMMRQNGADVFTVQSITQ